MDKRVAKYIRLKRFSGTKLIEYFGSGKFEEFMLDADTLYDPGFWVFRLKEDYKATNKGDNFNDLSVSYDTYKYIHQADKQYKIYLEDRSNVNFAVTHQVLGELLKNSVNSHYCTVYYYLITRYGAPVLYNDGLVVNRAIFSLPMGPIKTIDVLIVSDRLTYYMYSERVSYSLIRDIVLENRYDILKHIITHDKRKDIGKSISYQHLLTDSILRKDKLSFVIFILKNIPYSIRSIYSTLRQCSGLENIRYISGSDNINVKSLDKVINKFYEMKDSIHYSLEILKDSVEHIKYPNVTFLHLLVHTNMQSISHQRDYVNIISLMAEKFDYNEYTIKGLYVNGGSRLLKYIDSDVLNLLIEIANNHDNGELVTDIREVASANGIKL